MAKIQDAEAPQIEELEKCVGRFVKWAGSMFAATAVSETVRKLDRANRLDARLVWAALNAYIAEKDELPF